MQHVESIISVFPPQISTNKVVLAAGAWSRVLGQKIGVQIPLKVNKHGYIVSDVVPGMKGRVLPNTRVFDDALYLKVSQRGNKL